MHDVSNIYRVPLLLHHQGVTDNLLRRLNLVPKPNKAFFNDWMSLAELVDSLTPGLAAYDAEFAAAVHALGCHGCHGPLTPRLPSFNHRYWCSESEVSNGWAPARAVSGRMEMVSYCDADLPGCGCGSEAQNAS